MKIVTLIASISLLFALGAQAEEYFFAEDTAQNFETQEFDFFDAEDFEDSENLEDSSFAEEHGFFLGCVLRANLCRIKANHHRFPHSYTKTDPHNKCRGHLIRVNACYGHH